MSDVSFANNIQPIPVADVVGAAGASHAGPHRSLGKAAVKLFWLSLRATWLVVLAPWRLLQAIRYSLTTSSVAVLLVGIMTLNIVWGYPWTGMFAACISLLGVGLFVSHWMRPRLRIDFSLPSFTPAGQPCHIVAHGTNFRGLPAFDFSLGLRAIDKRSRKRGRALRPEKLIETSPPVYFGVARPGDRIDVESTVVFHRRGIHTIPDVVVTTTFPFHLFYHRQVIKPTTCIAVTPRPLTGDEDAPARALLHAMGGWSHRLLSGDALDYTGSREYQPGMPVRRWDFSSWARLGRPIVREYQSPSMQSVFLLVDTAISEGSALDQGNRLMERALSLAATAINDLTCKSIRIQLYVTSESAAEQFGQSPVRASATDSESMQIRLAQATSVESTTADERIREVLLEASAGPTLLITSRRHADAIDDLPGSIDVICVDQAVEVEPAASVAKASKEHKIRLDTAHHAGQRESDSSKSQSIAVPGSRR